MAINERFSPEAWDAVIAGPFHAAFAIIAADPGGVVGAAKEAAALAGILSAGDGAGGLVDEVAAAIGRDRPAMGDLGLRRRPRDEVLTSSVEAMRHAVSVVHTTSPEEAGAYARWLVAISERVAQAANEGGVLGLGGERVSEDEQAALSRIRATLGA